jgi:catechol 2,3-dioxygenase-like lactoylglutathione lyase family enzyme
LTRACAGRDQQAWRSPFRGVANTKTTEVFLTLQETDMSATEASVGTVDMKLEVQVIPVSDVDRSKQFYEQAGWRLDEDVAPMPGLRIVQFTPLGSGTSVDFGQGLTTAAPGAAVGTLVVSNVEAARDELVGRGIEVSDIWHGPPFPVQARQPGIDPERASYGSFFSVTDPDGNLWLVQEVTTRRPGRMNPTETGYVTAADLEGALRRAEAAHGEREKHSGGLLHRSHQDENWPAWYASYMAAEQAGTDLPS